MLVISRNGTSVFTIADNGDVTVQADKSVAAFPGSSSGMLQFAYFGKVTHWFRNVSGINFFEHAGNTSDVPLVPAPEHLNIHSPTTQRICTLTSEGNLQRKGKVIESNNPPSSSPLTESYNYTLYQDGPYATARFVFGVADNIYTASGSPNEVLYVTGRDTRFTTRRINASSMLRQPLQSTANDNISTTSIPLNGVVHIPNTTFRSPLVAVVQGGYTSDSYLNSAPGYDYLMKRLASYGCIAFSFEGDFLNQIAVNELDLRPAAKALMLVELINQFKTWDATPGHPLYGRIDFGKVMLIGHSEGASSISVAQKVMLDRSAQSYLKFFNKSINGFESRQVSWPVSGLPSSIVIKAMIGLGGSYNANPVMPGPSPSSTPLPWSMANVHALCISATTDEDVQAPVSVAYIQSINDAKSRTFVAMVGGTHAYHNDRWVFNINPAGYISRDQQKRVNAVYCTTMALYALNGFSSYRQKLEDVEKALDLYAWSPAAKKNYVTQVYAERRTTIASNFRAGSNGALAFDAYNSTQPGTITGSTTGKASVVLDFVAAGTTFSIPKLAKLELTTAKTAEKVPAGGAFGIYIQQAGSGGRFDIVFPYAIPAPDYEFLSFNLYVAILGDGAEGALTHFDFELSDGTNTAQRTAYEVLQHQTPVVNVPYGFISQVYRIDMAYFRQRGIYNVRRFSLIFNSTSPDAKLYISAVHLSGKV